MRRVCVHKVSNMLDVTAKELCHGVSKNLVGSPSEDLEGDNIESGRTDSSSPECS